MSRHDERRRVVDMKQLPFIIVVVAVVVAYVFVWKKEPQGSSAAKEPVKELTLEEKIVGAYEFDNERSQQIVVFHDSGKMESYKNGKKEGKEFRWKVVGGEVHAEYKDGYGSMWGIEPDGSLMQLGPLVSGQRHYLPRIPHYQPYWKKIPNYKEKIRRAVLYKTIGITETVIREILKKPEGEITEADLRKVTSLNLKSKNISNASALKMFPQLKQLNLWSNKISDLSALKELTQLRELELSNNKITNLSALQGLKELTRLSLYNNKISDVSALKELTNLKDLQLGRNSISDVSDLRKLIQLNDLLLYKNNISDVSPLKELKQLVSLHLKDNPDLTKAQIAELQKALPKCKISHNATK